LINKREIKIALTILRTIGDASLNGTICRLYAKDNIYNRSGSKKYFSKDEAIADFKFDSYGVPNTNIPEIGYEGNCCSISDSKAEKVLGVGPILLYKIKNEVSSTLTVHWEFNTNSGYRGNSVACVFK